MPEQAYKRCTKCGTVKPLDDFPRERRATDGRQSYCKACDLAKNRAWRRANRRREAARHRRWREDHPEYMAAAQKLYPEKHNAREAARNAVKDGRLVKPDCCEDCGGEFEPRLLQGHHADYSKPLEVEWLCGNCHGARHRLTFP